MNFVRSIKFRFTVWYLLVLGILLASLSTGLYFNLSRSLYENLDHSLEVRVAELKGIRGILSIIGQGEFQEELGEVVMLYFYSGNELIELSGRGVEVPRSEELVQKAFASESAFINIETPEGQSMRLYAAPFAVNEPRFFPGRPRMFPSAPNPLAAVLVVGRSTSDIDEALSGLLRMLIIAVPLTLVVAGAGGVFLANRALKPVEHIAQTALQIEEGGDLSQRIKVSTKDELGRLASTLNQMIERLQRAFNRQKEFTADASHELRTPLAVIQAESTLALQKERTASENRSSLEMVS